MYRILLPTDFSKNSIGAIDFVIEQFKTDQVELILLNIIRSPHSAAGVLIRIDGLMQRDAEEDMRKLVEHIRIRHGIRPETIVKIGYLNEWIKKNVQAYNIDLVAMGTKGESNLSSKLMGSVTESVIRTSPVPVLAVPFKDQSAKMHHVVVATPLDEIPQRDKFKEFLLSLRLSHLKLNVLHVEKEQVYAMPKSIALNGYQVGVETVVSDTPVDGINRYIDTNPTDLLVLFHKRSSKLDYFFNRSITKTICSKTEVPLLVMPAG